jgi:hypothetical protein
MRASRPSLAAAPIDQVRAASLSSRLTNRKTIAQENAGTSVELLPWNYLHGTARPGGNSARNVRSFHLRNTTGVGQRRYRWAVGPLINAGNTAKNAAKEHCLPEMANARRDRSSYERHNRIVHLAEAECPCTFRRSRNRVSCSLLMELVSHSLPRRQGSYAPASPLRRKLSFRFVSPASRSEANLSVCRRCQGDALIIIARPALACKLLVEIVTT